MPTPSTTRLDYGDSLATVPGIVSSPGSINVDAFGLTQAQVVYSFDSSDPTLTNMISSFTMGVDYPYSLGFEMRSHKYSFNLLPGGVGTLTVDYMGVARGVGNTDCQITGVSNTTAQPIETHPNFTIITDSTIISNGPLGGKPAQPSTNKNKPIFIPSSDYLSPWRFDGFGLPADGTRNIKAGIRQYLRPMYSVRGIVFFNKQNAFKAAIMTNGVGRTLFSAADMAKLITPASILGAQDFKTCLLTAANAECIGTPDEPAGIKVVYDIMLGGDLGWDPEIYGPMAQSIF